MNIKSISYKFNLYDKIIILIISLLAFGNIGQGFQPIRIVTILFIPYILNLLQKKSLNRTESYISIFFIFWLFYDIFSLLWTNNRPEAFKEIFYYIDHFSLFFLLILFSKFANNPIIAIIYGWILFFSLTVPIALVEIIYDWHLPLSLLSSSDMINLGNGDIVMKKFASVTFGNYNTYSLILTYILPFAYLYILLKRKFIQQIVGWIIILTISFILLINASRGGILSLIVTSILFLITYTKSKIRFKNFVLFVLFILFSILIYKYSSVIFQQISFRFVNGNSIFSDESRINLYKAQFSLIKNSYLLGTGIGSMSTSLAGIYSIDNLAASHNFFLEILLQYGILVFSFFSFFIYKLFIKSLYLKNKYARFLIGSSLASFIVSSVINSGYLLLPVIWVLFSCLYIIYFYGNQIWTIND